MSGGDAWTYLVITEAGGSCAPFVELKSGYIFEKTHDASPSLSFLCKTLPNRVNQKTLPTCSFCQI